MRVLLVGLLVSACHAPSGDTSSTDAAPVIPGIDAVAITPPPSTCTGVMTHETPLMAASHVPQGTAVTWSSNPPSSGPHYPTFEPWAQAYPVVVPRGNYLHNEEHGGVILLYNCAGDCADVVDGLTAIGNGLPQDPLCTAPVNAKWILSRDPLLPPGIQVAAAAWGWTYKATCLDPVSLGAFITARYAQGGSDRTNCTIGTDDGT